MPGVMPTSSTPSPGPGQEPPHRRLIRFLRVRIVMLGIEEFIPGEAGRPPCPLDQLRQGRMIRGCDRGTVGSWMISVAMRVLPAIFHRPDDTTDLEEVIYLYPGSERPATACIVSRRFVRCERGLSPPIGPGPGTPPIACTRHDPRLHLARRGPKTPLSKPGVSGQSVN